MTHRPPTISSAAMASAPMKYGPDGSVDWGNMWDTFCALALDGGPAHRASMLQAQEDADINSDAYRFAANEIVRGVFAVSGLEARSATPGWLALCCPSMGMAHWLSEAIKVERVQARADGSNLFVPVGEWRAVNGEIKNVITVVAKTTHYWYDHVPPDVRRTLDTQERIAQWSALVMAKLRRFRSALGSILPGKRPPTTPG